MRSGRPTIAVGRRRAMNLRVRVRLEVNLSQYPASSAQIMVQLLMNRSFNKLISL